MIHKKPVFKFGILHIYSLNRNQKKTIEFWGSMVRTVLALITCTLVLYNYLGR